MADVDRRPSFSSVLGSFGLDATVTPPGGSAVTTVVVWLPPVTVEVPVGSEYRRAEARRVLAIPLDGMPSLPRGTVVNVPEFLGETAKDWTLDESARVDFDHYRAVVRESEVVS